MFIPSIGSVLAEKLWHILAKIAIFCIVRESSSASVYMLKARWNTVILDGSTPQGEMERTIDNSFKLMVSKMTKKEQRSFLVNLSSYKLKPLLALK